MSNWRSSTTGKRQAGGFFLMAGRHPAQDLTKVSTGQGCERAILNLFLVTLYDFPLTMEWL